MSDTMERGAKEVAGKLRLDLVPAEWLNALGQVMTFGAKKYGDWNWSRGVPYSELMGAAKRHINAFELCENVADDSQLHHLSHAAVDLLMLYFFECYPRYIDFDDRLDRYHLKDDENEDVEEK